MARWDSHVLWEATCGTTWSAVTGRKSEQAHYVLTREALYLEVLGDTPEQDAAPLELVMSATVERSIAQRVVGLADIKLQLDKVVRVLQSVATLANVEDAERVRRDLAARADPDPTPEARGEAIRAELPIPQQLRELAALHDAGAITDDEFTRLKAKLIDQ